MNTEAADRTLGVVAETLDGELRVAATPHSAAALIKLGYDVLVESGAGLGASHDDDAYTAVGARVVSREQAWHARVVVKVNPPTVDELAQLRDAATLIALLAPATNADLVSALAARRELTALALDAVPRISRAQSMDVLSSMANIAGYRAVIEAAHEFGRFFTGQVTAAGKSAPAKVLVAGAGVAGLAAIGAASSLGAIVRATDPRPEVADQVASIGGEYLPIIVADEQQTASIDGYAKATSEAYDRRAAELYSEQAADVDIIITTALIPGRAAPRLITAADVAAMRPGSVIVDMAAAQGGNVEGSVAGQRIVSHNGVTIIGYTDLASRLPGQASQFFGTNVVNLLKLLTPDKQGELVLDLDDVIQRAITVVHNGETLWPPPAIQVSASPKTAAPATTAPPSDANRRPLSARAMLTLIGIGAGLLFLLNAFAPDPLPQHFSVLMLAIVIGYYVIGNVHHALHTPLMSVTNAISGIVIVGAMLQISVDDGWVRALAFAAVLVASINVFGGFSVTRRMLSMFRKDPA